MFASQEANAETQVACDSQQPFFSFSPDKRQSSPMLKSDIVWMFATCCLTGCVAGMSFRGSAVTTDQLKPGVTLRGRLFPEPVQVLACSPLAGQYRISAHGLQTGQSYQQVLTAAQLSELEASSQDRAYNGDPALFRLGIEAIRLGLAYEYDPYFSLSIARVDPLPHQLEAVYDHFLKLPRIRFLLADDPGAGKTIMAGLLVKELKARGLIKRVLIVTPANLCFQWQRELKDKFREDFALVNAEVLRANYGQNPWQRLNQAITSVSWVSRIEDARDSLKTSHWDLVIVDEAHKMSAYDEEHKTLAYQLGEELSEQADHYLLMTATPHKGDPANFCFFLRLLDKDVYADVTSLQEAMQRSEAPFYLRRTKEALVSFPDPDTGKVQRLFTHREVQTLSFQVDAEELDFYNALTAYVEEQTAKATADESPRGRVLSFTMAMLQRRFASSVRAARRSLERMRIKREEILQDPEGYRQKQLARKLPDDFEDLPEEDQQNITEELESIVASYNPEELRLEIRQLDRLVQQALKLEERQTESKLTKLRETLEQEGIFSNPEMKLLLFTEHRDTLEYLVEKLSQWGLSVTQIHGGMKVGDRNAPNTRLWAERRFREDCQVLVATEAAGEGINLQFCWFMINYDIPWNPVRLEQRMGRIHRYGQERDCLILNFVASNTREGRVLNKLFERVRKIEDDLDPERTGKVFNVIGDVLPANWLEGLLRDMYARNQTEQTVLDRIVDQVDTKRFEAITKSTLEGLAKRELNLAALVGKSAQAKERRLVPEVVEGFFEEAVRHTAVSIRPRAIGEHVYNVGRLSTSLIKLGNELEGRFGKLGREYKTICFDKKLLTTEPTLEWITPGHPLFEAVRELIRRLADDAFEKGALFYDFRRTEPVRLDAFEGSISDGAGHVLHKRLFVVETSLDGKLRLLQPTALLDLIPAKDGVTPPAGPVTSQEELEAKVLVEGLQPLLEEVQSERSREISTIEHHLNISLNALINRLQYQYGVLEEQRRAGLGEAGLEGRIQMTADRLDELNVRLEQRAEELQRERNCLLGVPRRLASAWVLPHPDRAKPDLAPMVQDKEIERIAVDFVTRAEEAAGWKVISVEEENRGFDLLCRRYDPEQEGLVIAEKYVEVKGRAATGDVALSRHEYDTACRLATDYWLCVVYNCASQPELHSLQDPARLGWQSVTAVEHYRLPAAEVLRQD